MLSGSFNSTVAVIIRFSDGFVFVSINLHKAAQFLRFSVKWPGVKQLLLFIYRYNPKLDITRIASFPEKYLKTISRQIVFLNKRFRPLVCYFLLVTPKHWINNDTPSNVGTRFDQIGILFRRECVTYIFIRARTIQKRFRQVKSVVRPNGSLIGRFFRSRRDVR